MYTWGCIRAHVLKCGVWWHSYVKIMVKKANILHVAATSTVWHLPWLYSTSIWSYTHRHMPHPHPVLTYLNLHTSLVNLRWPWFSGINWNMHKMAYQTKIAVCAQCCSLHTSLTQERCFLYTICNPLFRFLWTVPTRMYRQPFWTRPIDVQGMGKLVLLVAA